MNRVFKKDILESEIIRSLKEVGISDPERVSNSYSFELSGGMAQRVVIALASFARPKLLFADEPTTGLDPIIARQINILIKNLVKQKKITTITVTHDMESVYEFADFAAFISEGKINWYGNAKVINKSGKKSLNNFIKGIVEDRR